MSSIGQFAANKTEGADRCPCPRMQICVGGGRTRRALLDICRRGAGPPPPGRWIRLASPRDGCGSSASSIEPPLSKAVKPTEYHRTILDGEPEDCSGVRLPIQLPNGFPATFRRGAVRTERAGRARLPFRRPRGQVGQRRRRGDLPIPRFGLRAGDRRRCRSRSLRGSRGREGRPAPRGRCSRTAASTSAAIGPDRIGRGRRSRGVRVAGARTIRDFR